MLFHLPNLVDTTKGLCWTVRILAFAAVMNFMLKVTVSKELAASCNGNQTRMRVRPESGPGQSHHAYHSGVVPFPAESNAVAGGK
jgi:hypothetical protein